MFSADDYLKSTGTGSYSGHINGVYVDRPLSVDDFAPGIPDINISPPSSQRSSISGDYIKQPLPANEDLTGATATAASKM